MSAAGLNRMTLLAAAAASLAVTFLSGLAGVVMGVASGATALTFVAIALAIEVRRDRSAAAAIPLRTMQQIGEGRKLVIYDQETGLYAPWYIELRCEEECYRSVRYKLPFTLLVLQPGPEADVWTLRGQLADWLRRQRRRSDIPGHLDDGRFILLMSETEVDGARRFIQRLREAVPGIEIAMSRHIEDGANFEQLVSAAAERLGRDGAETAA